ncbi:MerR family transcriptional regulator [Actinokineospora sp. HUAS TT18]|uniref:MerR family transcriptional regulator n=1 Tax=Actinokineospora sp. HUAS TT18 TaxID=3447451 RepID=UPI003F51D3EF
MTGNQGVDQRRWSVGALAKLTGLTVRTLHHYDELGLLRPSERTHSGHRRYTEQDLRRLYQIRLLRQLGMALDEISPALVDPSDPGPLRKVLADHLDELDDRVWRLTSLRRQTSDLLRHLDGRRASGDVLALMGCTSIFEDYLTKEQREFLDDQADDLGADGRERLEAEWPDVLANIVRHYRADTPVDDPDVRATARRLAAIATNFAGDDPDILKSMSGFFREHGMGVLRDVLGDQEISDLGDGLWDYLSRVRASAE